MKPQQVRKPHKITKHDWYYVYPRYLWLVHDCVNNNGIYMQTDQIKVPWKMIERSIRQRKVEQSIRRRKQRLSK
jgi:hypothetical protein